MPDMVFALQMRLPTLLDLVGGIFLNCPEPQMVGIDAIWFIAGMANTKIVGDISPQGLIKESVG